MYTFKLPDIGEGVNEGEIVKWHVSEGDHIGRDQDMVEVMTDKVTVKVPSPVEGTVSKIYHQEGAVVEVGTVLIDIDNGGAAPAAAATEAPAAPSGQEAASAQAPEQPRAPEQAEEEEEEIPGGIVTASPAVRRIARERGIKLSQIHGTGPNGRVTLEDLGTVQTGREEKAAERVEEVVEEIREEAPEAEAAPAAPGPEAVKQAEEPVKRPAGETGLEPVQEKDEILVPRGLRRLIFEKMAKSKQVMPHFTIMEQIRVGPIRENISKLRNDGLSVTFTPFFIKAAAIALKDFPKMNAHYDDENKRYIIKKHYNMGVAIDTPDGLTVAVVKDADRKSLVGISSEVVELAGRARENKLELSEVQGSTFTVSNVGSIGGIMSTPIINYPEVAIMGVHRTLTGMDSNGNEEEFMYISLSCDHRIIDGADAARFVKRLRKLLEEPILILSQ